MQKYADGKKTEIPRSWYFGYPASDYPDAAGLSGAPAFVSENKDLFMTDMTVRAKIAERIFFLPFSSFVESTFFVFGIFPPPTPGSEVFASGYGPCTGLAADTRKSFVVEVVVWNSVGLNIIPDVFFRPVNKRIDLY